MSVKITQADLRKMEDEITHRSMVVRKEALEAVKEARAQGDLSENFEYKAAKQAKNRNESRIRYLEKVIKNAEIIEDTAADDEIGVYKTVTLYFEDDDETDEYTIVSTMQADSLLNRISIESPLGKVLMEHRVGDRVHVNINGQAGYDVIVKAIRPADDETLNAPLRSY
ncbi:MAG: transcription elongation factor GreA [Lachnospiraceae bacterium]|nr:transcription elongation factor GreA [Lachnospiraceae bacterium]